MNKALGLLSTAGVATVLVVLLTMGGGPPIEDIRPALIDDTCHDGLDCVAGMFQRPAGCMCFTDNPNTLPDEITDVATIPANQKKRMVGCCDVNDNKSVWWQWTVDPVGGSCIQIAGPHLFAGDSMHNISLGNVEFLNELCCDAGEVVEGMAPGSWGQCPHCTFACNPAHKPYITPGGCDAFCVVEGT